MISLFFQSFLFLSRSAVTESFTGMSGFVFVLLCSFSLIGSYGAYADESPEIEIKGVNDKSEKNIRAFLSLSKEPCDAPQWRVQQLFEKSDQQIDKALRALGYYQPVIRKQLTFKESCWSAKFKIKPGLPVIVHTLNVSITGEAQQEPVFQRWLNNLPIREGDILNHGHYEKIKQDLHSLALDYGFLDYVLVTKQLIVDQTGHSAEINIVMDSGVRHRFGAITIEQSILDPEFVKRYITLKQGNEYSSRQLAKTYNQLAASPYFGKVSVQPQTNVEGVQVPVNIALQGKDSHDLSVGVGYDTNIGPLGSLNYQNFRINRHGHHFALDLQLSPVLSNAEARYSVPLTDTLEDQFTFGLGYQFERPNTFKSESAILSAQYLHVYQTTWRQNLFVNITYDNFTISDDTQRTKLLEFGGNWQYRQANHPLRPTQGYSVDVMVSGAPDLLFSDVGFIRSRMIGKYITSLPWNARLIGRSQLGATISQQFEKLPARHRFFAGGNESIRGYNYKELGPRDSDGIVIGGRMLAIVSLEYEQFINDEWGVAAFMDIGNAFELDQFKLKRGVGFGIRWLSPIGPIRLDFAFPLNESNDSFQIHFAAGALLS